VIYLLHASHPIGTAGSNSAMHYLGFCEDTHLWTRMKQHATGTSRVPIIRAFLETGATLYLVRVWPDGGRGLERHLKNLGHFKKHCPVCLGWLPQDRAVSIEVASMLLPTFERLRSPKPMLSALTSALSGTGASKDGPYAQLVIQAPSTWSGSVAGVSLATPGGPASTVAVLMNGRAVRSAGTKLPSSASGKTPESASTPVSQRRPPLGEPGPTPHEMQLELGLADEEGFQV